MQVNLTPYQMFIIKEVFRIAIEHAEFEKDKEDFRKIDEHLHNEFLNSGEYPTVAAAYGGGPTSRIWQEEQTEWDVVIESIPGVRINVIKAVRQITPGLGLKDAADLIGRVPVAVKSGVSKVDAEDFKKILIAAGAKVILK